MAAITTQASIDEVHDALYDQDGRPRPPAEVFRMAVEMATSKLQATVAAAIQVQANKVRIETLLSASELLADELEIEAAALLQDRAKDMIQALQHSLH